MISYNNYAAKCLKYSQAVLFTAGAGIGVDSGMPTLRKEEEISK